MKDFKNMVFCQHLKWLKIVKQKNNTIEYIYYIS